MIREDLDLAVVADGMGGHAAGEVAAQLAVQEIERFVEATGDALDSTWPEDWDPSLSLNANRLSRGIEAAHRSVTQAVEDDSGLKGMGATIVACILDPTSASVTIAHVGDSRAYVMRQGRLRLLTSDHSWVNEQVVAGLLSEEAARNHPLKNVVTRALGGSQEPTVDIVEEELQTDDLLLLCTDGLNTMLSDDDIESTLLRCRDLDEITHELIDEANRRGGIDNITVIVVRVSG